MGRLSKFGREAGATGTVAALADLYELEWYRLCRQYIVKRNAPALCFKESHALAMQKRMNEKKDALCARDMKRPIFSSSFSFDGGGDESDGHSPVSVSSSADKSQETVSISHASAILEHGGTHHPLLLFILISLSRE